MFRCKQLKQFKSLTLVTFSCLSGLQVTHRTAVLEVQGSIPGSEYFYVCFYVSLFVLFFGQTQIKCSFGMRYNFVTYYNGIKTHTYHL